MTEVSEVKYLRIIAFFLFLIPALGLVGSLLAHNALVSFKFSTEPNYNLIKFSPGESTKKYKCNEQNNYCELMGFEHYKTLGECNKYIVKGVVFTEDDKILDHLNKIINLEDASKKLNQKLFKRFVVTDKINNFCIKNSNLSIPYKIFPFLFETLYKIKENKKTSLGTSKPVNPIFYGETSISNIVKRYPIKLIFKPLMYISVILMLLYWYFNTLILNKLINIKIKNKFFVFGVLSSIFLLLHVFFLGMNFENEILTKLRRSYVVFFILFEVLAQAFLIKNIFKRKSELSGYVNKTIVNIKLGFVIFICVSTLMILLILSTSNLDSAIDYILEWNYFLILLIYYLLSFLIWKKSSFRDPSST